MHLAYQKCHIRVDQSICLTTEDHLRTSETILSIILPLRRHFGCSSSAQCEYETFLVDLTFRQPSCLRFHYLRPPPLPGHFHRLNQHS